VESLSLDDASTNWDKLNSDRLHYFTPNCSFKDKIRSIIMPIEVKNFATQADEAKEMPNAQMKAVNVLGQRVMKLTLAPDWKWSTDIKPIVGTPSCQATHTGVIVEGTIHCVCDDGSEATYSAGDAYAISPNHDAWCVGGNRAVVYEFAGMWGE
jgi:hypothetical protein